MRSSILVAIFILGGCGPVGEVSEEQDPLTNAEISILSPNAKLWRQSGALDHCGTWAIDEDFSSGSYNVHRYAIAVSPGGPIAVRLARTAGTWQPAIVVGTRSGVLIYGGEQSSSAGGISAELAISGRTGSLAELRLTADRETSVDVYVTGFGPLDDRFQSKLPRSARYNLSVRHECAVVGGAWQTLAAGLLQGGAQIPRQGIANPTLQNALGVRSEPYGTVVSLDGHSFVRGKTSEFGGPNDTGVTPSETGAISGERLRSLNNPLHPSAATLSARPEDYYYAAMRFDYTGVGRNFWKTARLLLVNPRTLAAIVVRPVDWGPNTSTGRVIDLSPQAMVDLDLDTDDTVNVSFAVVGASLGVARAMEMEPEPEQPAGAIYRPTPGTSWQWQLSGTVDTSFAVSMYDVDLFDASASLIDGLRARGIRVICYFSAGTFEDWRPDAGSFPSSALGAALDDFPDERWLDVRSAAVREIMRARMDLAVEMHCDGVEPDNVDGFDNTSGFTLTANDQLEYNRFLAREAHARSLSVGLKNDVDQAAALVGDFDWALNEECFAFDECDQLRPFIAAGKAVFQVEYRDVADEAEICPRANALDFDTLIKNRESVDAWRISCR